MIDDRPFYDRRGAAARVGRGLSTIYRWEKQGLIHPVVGHIRTDELLEADRIMCHRGGDQTQVGSSAFWLSRKDAAERIERSIRTLHRWEQQGVITFWAGRVPLADLLEAARQKSHRYGRLTDDKRK